MVKIKLLPLFGVLLLALGGCQQPVGGKAAGEAKLKAAAQRAVGFQCEEFKIEFSKIGNLQEAYVVMVPKPPSREPRQKVVLRKDGDEWRVMEVLKIADKVIEIDLYKIKDQYEIRGYEIRNVGDWHYMKDCKNYKGRFPYGSITDKTQEPLGYFQMPHGLRIIICWDAYDPVKKKMTGGMREQSEGKIKLELPYIPEGKYAIIYDESENKILTIDIQEFCIIK